MYHLQGRSYFLSKHWTDLQIQKFLAKPSVRRELERLSIAFDNRAEQEEKQQFVIRQRVASIANDALAVVQDSVRGHSLQGTAQQPVRAPAPSEEQLKAAKLVIETLGIKEKYTDRKSSSTAALASNAEMMGLPADPKGRRKMIRALQRLSKLALARDKISQEMPHPEDVAVRVPKKLRKRRRTIERIESGSVPISV